VQNLGLFQATDDAGSCLSLGDVIDNSSHTGKSLRPKVNDGSRRWQPRSPAMAAGITDHMWLLEELLTRVPIGTST